MKREVVKIENSNVYIPHSVDVWMTQHEIADLFECFVSKISSDIRSILKSGVLRDVDICRMYYYKNGNCIEQYNLEIITALSFRIKSKNAEIFRNWLSKKISKPEIPEMFLMAIKNPILN